MKRFLKKKELMCIAAGFLLGFVLFIVEKQRTAVENIDFLERNTYGRGSSKYELMVEGLEENAVALQLEIEEQKYLSHEVKEIIESTWKDIEGIVCGDNSSLSDVAENLVLVNEIPDKGIYIRWYSKNPEIIDSFGTVYAEQAEPDGTDVILTAEITDGNYTEKRDVKVCVFPPRKSESQQTVHEFEQMLKFIDRSQSSTDMLYLPKEYKGHKLRYYTLGESDYKIFPLLGMVLAAVLYINEQAGRKRETMDRERQMLIDYPEIVSKLVVFLGAGMTVPTAWEKIVQDYEKNIKSGKKKRRIAYEEMCQTYYQIRDGMSEGIAYEEFGRRCRVRPYLKLSSILEQNRKNGSKNMRNMLESEMEQAFEQRKHLAKRLGEEAGTRLLLPLFFMLGIVMVMIIVPAFMAFY